MTRFPSPLRLAFATVSLALALPPTASAAIVHVTYTGDEITGEGFPTVNQTSPLPFDFDGDARTDLTLRQYVVPPNSTDGIWVEPSPGGGALFYPLGAGGLPRLIDTLAALAIGVEVGSTAPSVTEWQTASIWMIRESPLSPMNVRYDVGFPPGGNYFGFSFLSDDGLHYGWMRMRSVSFTGARVSEWAYESEPGRPISVGAVPEPGSAALVGGLGVLCGVTRRRRGRL